MTLNGEFKGGVVGTLLGALGIGIAMYFGHIQTDNEVLEAVAFMQGKVNAIESRLEDLPYPSESYEFRAWRDTVSSHIRDPEIHKETHARAAFIEGVVIEVLRQQEKMNAEEEKASTEEQR